MAATLGISSCTQAPPAVSKDDPDIEAAFRIAAPFMETTKRDPGYTNDLALQGILTLYETTRDPELLRYVKEVFEYREKAPHSYKILFTCIHYDAWKTLKEDWLLEGLVDQSRLLQENVNFTPEGAAGFFDGPNGTPGAIFTDMLSGYMLHMAIAGNLNKEKADDWFEDCASQYEIHHDILCDPETGLWHHARGWDANLPNELAPYGWARGQAWLLRGLVESLDLIPPGDPAHKRLKEELRKLADTLISYQLPNGMWPQIMQEDISYPETSATGLIAYYLYRAMWQGHLPEKPYLEHAQNAVKGLHEYIREDGRVLNGCVGTPPLPSLQEYRDRPHEPGEAHTIGPVIMALCAPTLYKHYK